MKINWIRIFYPTAILVLLLAGSWIHAENFCSKTADQIFTSCNTQANADAQVKNANCINYSDTSKRDQCFADLQQEKSDAKDECDAQHTWRLKLCSLTGQDRYDPVISGADFDTDFHNLTKPNPYYPLGIGNHWEYKGGGEVNTVDVTSQTKLIDGVTCIVVHDKVFTDGFLTESTSDWFAQNLDGDTWYFGEDTREYETFEGDHPKKIELVSREGSFKAGRDDAKPGIIFLATPKVGAGYFEEFALSIAEDVTKILSTTYSFGSNPNLDKMVPQALAQRFCTASDCVVTENLSLLEPNTIERKYYAKGIGVFLEVELTAGDISQLTDCNFDSRCKNLPQPKP